MKILFVVPYPPSLIRVRPYNLIRELSLRGNQVIVATVWTGEQERVDAENLTAIANRIEVAQLPRWRSYWNCLVSLPTNKPLQSVYSWQPALYRQFKDGLGNGDLDSTYDVVHIEHIRGARYGLEVKRFNPRLPVVWDSVDCISLLFRLASGHSKKRTSRWLTRFELGRTLRYEGWLPVLFDHTLVTSKIDREAMLELTDSDGTGSTPKISVLPNGVDLDYFKPDDSQMRQDDTLVVSGKMSYHANISMVLHLVQTIMPRVWASQPGVKLWIVGKDPSTQIRSLAEDPRITVTGTVDDIRPYLRQTAVSVSPVTYGVGIQNKVLEAMACGTPVVSTPQAVSTLEVVQGEDVLVAEDPDRFASHILELLGDRQYRERIGRAGLRYVHKHHRWSNVAEKLEGIYAAAINHLEKPDLSTNNQVTFNN